MKNMKKILVFAMAMLLVMAISIAGTVAYLVNLSDPVTNTFTVGDVNIDLDETDVDVYGVKDGDDRVKANNYKLLPGHAYTKDPIVHVQAGSEQCYLFVKIIDEIANIQAAPTVAAQMEAKGWIALDGVDNVYYYNAVVDARTEAKDVPVFDNFTINGTISNDTIETYAGKTIKIQAYAVQKDTFDSAAAAYAAAGCTWTIE